MKRSGPSSVEPSPKTTSGSRRPSSGTGLSSSRSNGSRSRSTHWKPTPLRVRNSRVSGHPGVAAPPSRYTGVMRRGYPQALTSTRHRCLARHTALAELHILDARGRCVRTRELAHLVGHVEPDCPPGGGDTPRGDDYVGAGTEVEHDRAVRQRGQGRRNAAAERGKVRHAYAGAAQGGIVRPPAVGASRARRWCRRGRRRRSAGRRRRSRRALPTCLLATHLRSVDKNEVESGYAKQGRSDELLLLRVGHDIHRLEIRMNTEIDLFNRSEVHTTSSGEARIPSRIQEGRRARY